MEKWIASSLHLKTKTAWMVELFDGRLRVEEAEFVLLWLSNTPRALPVNEIRKIVGEFAM